MTMARQFKRSPLALAILALLYEAPMHPYRMQQLIRERKIIRQSKDLLRANPEQYGIGESEVYDK